MTFTFDFGFNIQDAIERFGETSVFRSYLIGAKTSARNRIIKLEKRGFSEEKIRENMAEWTPKTPEERKEPYSISNLRKEFDLAPPELKDEIRAALRRIMGESQETEK